MNPWQITAFTLATAAAATLLMLPPGLLLAWVLARGRFRGRVVLETFLSLPLVMPPVATGLVLLMLVAPRGPLGSLLARLGLEIVFTWKAVVLAMAVMGLPLLVRTVQGRHRTGGSSLRGGGGDARRRPAAGFCDHHRSACGASRCCRCDARLCPRARRVWRHHHDCGKHSRLDPNARRRDLLARGNRA